MTGNILYMFYSVFITVSMIILSVTIRVKKGSSSLKSFIILSLPILLFIQVYFWNSKFNDFTKSLLFPSKVYECGYVEDLKNISIPLPKRTVFHGKEDACSSRYSTYINDHEFTHFYENELNKLTNKKEIKNYSYVEKNDGFWVEEKGYSINLLSGSKLEIFIHRRESENNWSISIDFFHNKKPDLMRSGLLLSVSGFFIF
ncbi:hypothetical protein ACQCN2_11750 [Brevibacillus ginsengisoli]|uniref:hypothetical protein n=1 Tax=Brevibacillus ginsengisoli TaxID=363854 RepID=UPI003CE700C3